MDEIVYYTHVGEELRRHPPVNGFANSVHDLDEEVANIDKRREATALIVRRLDTQLATITSEVDSANKRVTVTEAELTTKRTFNFQGNDVTSTSTEVWDLSGDGKTLTIQRTSESPRGTQSSTLVFNKQ